jgi:hypothetical protein
MLIKKLIKYFFNKLQNKKFLVYIKWLKDKKSSPPPHFIKENTVKKYTKKYGINIFIETGTYYGDMINAVKHLFKNIFSIELDRILYEKSKERFKDYNKIFIINGDSSKVLPEILKNINEPILFWLDAHYSGDITAKGDCETPIIQELEAIFKNYIAGSIILIDDARLFIGKNDYPTIDVIEEFVKLKEFKLNLIVNNDIIIIN